jgi:mono/diheme cytochrome c family protein
MKLGRPPARDTRNPQMLQAWQAACLHTFLIMAAAFALTPDQASANHEHPGKAIYAEQCASCHGNDGQGTEDNYAKLLAGDRPLVELAKVITRTMPEGESEACVGKNAELVAAYIYDAFYSPVAQARIRPPRVELARLTNTQYRNAVADLIGLFRGGRTIDDKRGLQAEYFASGRYQRNKELDFKRVDPIIDFDFGEDVPPESKFKKKEEFSIRWQGSVIAPETGDYEFVIKTDNGFQFWLNHSQIPFIDGKVRAGNDAEYRKTMFMIGGRPYPLRLDFSKFNGKSGEMRQRWKAPHKIEEPIPKRFLTPSRYAEVLTVETPFPPDDRSEGYARGTSVSKEWDAATTSAAIEVAAKVFDDLNRLSGSRPDKDNRSKKLRSFCERLVERALRQRLTDEQKRLYIESQFEKAADEETAVRRVVMLALKSPRFLYREIGGENNTFNIASRLSFGLWDCPPDNQLWNGANGNSLDSRVKVARFADRMVNNPRTRTKLREFFHYWLKLDHLTDVSKDAEQFAGFDKTLQSDLRTSLELTIDDFVSRKKPDFRDLFLDNELFLNGRLAAFYKADLPLDAPFRKVAFEPDARSGILSHPFLMSGFAYHDLSSPIHRGVFISRSILGRSLKPPAEAITPVPPKLHPALTTRQRVALQTNPVACRSCHEMINPLGFALENFDAAGRFRKKEHNHDIDASGSYLQQTGELAKFSGAKQLGEFLAASDEVHLAFVEQLFQHAVKQPIQAYGSDQKEKLRDLFVRSDFNINVLLAEIATVAAFDHPTIDVPPSETAAR